MLVKCTRVIEDFENFRVDFAAERRRDEPAYFLGDVVVVQDKAVERVCKWKVGAIYELDPTKL